MRRNQFPQILMLKLMTDGQTTRPAPQVASLSLRGPDGWIDVQACCCFARPAPAARKALRRTRACNQAHSPSSCRPPRVPVARGGPGCRALDVAPYLPHTPLPTLPQLPSHHRIPTPLVHRQLHSRRGPISYTSPRRMQASGAAATHPNSQQATCILCCADSDDG
jgi:hypothetical protein